MMDIYLNFLMKIGWNTFRVDITEKISLYAKNLGQVFIEQKQWGKVGLIGNKLLILNSFHDDGMRYSVLANKMLKKMLFRLKYIMILLINMSWKVEKNIQCLMIIYFHIIKWSDL